MIEMKNQNFDMLDVIDSDSQYVEEMLSSVLALESDSITKIDTFSEIGLRSKGKGLILTLNDGKRYFLPITMITPSDSLL